MKHISAVLPASACRRFCERSGIPLDTGRMDVDTRESVLDLIPIVKTGRMPLDIQPIVFDTDNTVVSGGERLAAAAISGMPIAAHVIEGVSPDARNYPHYPSRPLEPLAVSDLTDPELARTRYQTLLDQGGEPLLLTIDPESAAGMLNGRNVVPPPDLNAQLRSDLWIVTGDCIILDPSGLVIEGRRRLAAVIRTGVPIPVWVLRTVTPVLRENTSAEAGAADINVELTPPKVRSSAVPAHGPVVAPSAEAGVVGEPLRRAVDEVLSILAAACGVSSLPVSASDLNWRAPTRLGFLLSNQREIAVAARAAFRLVDQKQADAFFDSLASGDGSAPVKALRKLLNNQATKLKATDPTARDRVIRQLCKAWRLHREGRDIEVLRLTAGDRATFGYVPPADDAECPVEAAAFLSERLPRVPAEVSYGALRLTALAKGYRDNPGSIVRVLSSEPTLLEFGTLAYDTALDRQCNPVAFVSAALVAASDDRTAARLPEVLESLKEGADLNAGSPVMELRNWLWRHKGVSADHPATLAEAFLSSLSAERYGKPAPELPKAEVGADIVTVLQAHLAGATEEVGL